MDSAPPPTLIVMIRWTGLAPWAFEFPVPGSLTSTFLVEKWQAWVGARRAAPQGPDPASNNSKRVAPAPCTSANVAHVRQSRPDSGLVFKTVQARFWPWLSGKKT